MFSTFDLCLLLYVVRLAGWLKHCNLSLMSLSCVLCLGQSFMDAILLLHLCNSTASKTRIRPCSARRHILCLGSTRGRDRLKFQGWCCWRVQAGLGLRLLI